MTEDEMVGWHHRLNGNKFEQALGVGDVLKKIFNEQDLPQNTMMVLQKNLSTGEHRLV